MDLAVISPLNIPLTFLFFCYLVSLSINSHQQPLSNCLANPPESLKSTADKRENTRELSKTLHEHLGAKA